MAERLRWAVVVVSLLAAGLLIGRWLAPDEGAIDEGSLAEATDFRTWLWERRTFDLLAQVGLIFAGALGVAAILPHSTEAPPAEVGDELD